MPPAKAPSLKTVAVTKARDESGAASVRSKISGGQHSMRANSPRQSSKSSRKTKEPSNDCLATSKSSNRPPLDSSRSVRGSGRSQASARVKKPKVKGRLTIDETLQEEEEGTATTSEAAPPAPATAAPRAATAARAATALDRSVLKARANMESAKAAEATRLLLLSTRQQQPPSESGSKLQQIFLLATNFAMIPTPCVERIVLAAIPSGALHLAARLNKRFNRLARLRLKDIASLHQPPFELSPLQIFRTRSLEFINESDAPEMGAEGAQTLASAFRAGALRCLQQLIIEGHHIGDVGLAALSKAIEKREIDGTPGLPRLTVLGLRENKIGDAGLEAFGRACVAGALPVLRDLDLYSNRIGDGGAEAIARACAAGALPHLRLLSFYSNDLENAGVQALAATAGGGALNQLEELNLSGNAVGDDGLSALSAVLAKGALPEVRSVGLVGIAASEESKQAVQRELKARVGGKGGVGKRS